MYTTAQSIHPVQTIFGAGFIPEQHSDDAGRNLPRSDESDVADFIERLRALCWGSDNAN